LNKHFALSHHAQLSTGTLFGSIRARSKIFDFSGKRNVARGQTLVNLTLISDLRLHIPNGKPTAPTHPQGILDQTD
jgi:hypothetical protein